MAAPPSRRNLLRRVRECRLTMARVIAAKHACTRSGSLFRLESLFEVAGYRRF